jgi:endo-1,4-beta-xylanase
MSNNCKDIKLSLCDAYKDYFSIGAAVTVADFQGVQAELLKKHFNSITAENAMKFGEIHPEENRYDFEKTDIMKEFALKNNMGMRGHTFVWHNQTSKWVFEDKNGKTASKELVVERLREHIHTVCNRYRGVIYAWDVVNEAIEDKAGQIYRDTRWLNILGEDYIKLAFDLVKEADKEAALYYNDYNNELPEKLQKSLIMLKDLKAKGAPIDGVGLQGHWNIRDKALLDNLKRAIESYAALDLKIQVTELDVSMFEFGDQRKDLKEPTAEMLSLQQQVYDDIFSVFRQYKDHMTNVTFWGISDAWTWKDNFPVPGRKDWPMLFDVKGEPKAAFENIVCFK